MAKGSGAPKFIGPMMLLVFMAIIGLVVLVVLKVGGNVKKDWQTVTDIRSKDAAAVRAEKEAGKAYLDKLRLTLAASRTQSPDGKPVAVLTGKIANTGSTNVIRAVAAVTFLTSAGGAPADTRDVILFDASELSMTTDRPIVGGEERDVSKKVSDVSPDWDGTSISYELKEARVDVGKE